MDRRILLGIICVFLMTIASNSTPVCNLIVKGAPQPPRILRIVTQNVTKMISHEGRNYTMFITSRNVVWSNDTMFLQFDATTFVGPGRLHLRASKVVTQKTQTAVPPMRVASSLPKEPIWGLLFVTGGNESCSIRYPHPDHYDTYFPGLWNHPWQLYGEEQYEGTKHVHLSADQLDVLEDETQSQAQLMSWIYAGFWGAATPCAIAVAKWALFGLAGAIGFGLVGSGIFAAIGLGIIGALYGWAAWQAQQQCASMQEWVQTKIRLEHNDGFMWLTYVTHRCYKWTSPDIYYFGNPVWSMPFKINRWYFVDFVQSWGSERETSEEPFTVDYCWCASPYSQTFTLG